MVDRADNNVAAGGESGGDEQHKRQMSHGATITRGNGRDTTEISIGGKDEQNSAGGDAARIVACA
jgi:hypothetical protein